MTSHPIAVTPGDGGPKSLLFPQRRESALRVLERDAFRGGGVAGPEWTRGGA